MKFSQELSGVVLQSLKEAADMGLEDDDKGMTPQELRRRLSNSRGYCEALTSSVLLEFLESCPQLVMPSPYQPGAYILRTVFESIENTQECSRKRKRASSPESRSRCEQIKPSTLEAEPWKLPSQEHLGSKSVLEFHCNNQSSGERPRDEASRGRQVPSSARVVKASLQDPASVRQESSAVLQNLPPSAVSGKPVSPQLKSEVAEVADATDEEELAQSQDGREADICVNSPCRPAVNQRGAIGAAENGSGSSSVWRTAFLKEQEVSQERSLKVVELQAQLNEVQKLAQDRQAALLELQALVEELQGKLKDRDSQIEELQRSKVEADNVQYEEFGLPFPGHPERARSSSDGAKNVTFRKPSGGGVKLEESRADPVTVAASGGVSVSLYEAWQALASYEPSMCTKQITVQKKPGVKGSEIVFKASSQEGEQKQAGGADHVVRAVKAEPGPESKEADEPVKKRGRGRPKGSGKVKQPTVVEEDFRPVREGEVKVHQILVEEERVSKPAAHPARKPSCKCCGKLPECRVKLQHKRSSLHRKAAARPLKAEPKGFAAMKWDDILVKALRKNGCKMEVNIRSSGDSFVKNPRKKGCKVKEELNIRSREVVNTSWLRSTESSEGMETVNEVGRLGQEGSASAMEAGKESEPPALAAETLLRRDYKDDSCAVVCGFRMLSFVKRNAEERAH